jgi:hypothetical protein
LYLAGFVLELDVEDVFAMGQQDVAVEWIDRAGVCVQVGPPLPAGLARAHDVHDCQRSFGTPGGRTFDLRAGGQRISGLVDMSSPGVG